MGLSIYPTPSASASSTPIGAGALVAVGTETKGWYKTTLAAGSYYIYAYTANNSIAINAYNNNIYSSNVTSISSRPYKLTLTTSDTVYLSTSWVFESNSANTDGNPFGNRQITGDNQRDYSDNPWSHWWESDNGRGCFVQYFYGDSQVVATAYDVSTGIPIFKNFPGGYNIGNFNYPAYNSYAGNAYFICGRQSTGRLFRSTNGTTWTNTQVSGQVGPYNFVYHGGGMYVCLSEGGAGTALSSSTDGVTWATRPMAGNGTLIHGTYGAGLHVVVGAGGKIYTSPDAYTWTPRTSGISNDIGVVKYNSTLGQFIACGRSSSHNATTPMMARSTDGITWTTMNPQPIKKGIDIAGGYFAGWIYGFSYGGDNADAPSYMNSLMVYNGEWYLNSGWAGSLFSTDGISWGYGTGPGQKMDVINGKLVQKQPVDRRALYYTTPSPLGYAIYQA
jgi:hypothetical protein